MRILLATFVCTLIVTINAFDIGNPCKCDYMSESNHNAKATHTNVRALGGLNIDGKHRSNVVFIAPNRVLTLAFVLFESPTSQDRIKYNRMLIFLPSATDTNGLDVFQVRSAVIPDKYKHPSYTHNIAILELRNNVRLPKFDSFPIVNPDEREGNKNYMLLGFMDNYRKIDLVRTNCSSSKCHEFFDKQLYGRSFEIVPKYNFCGIKTCARTSLADVGFPLVSQEYLIGIALACDNVNMACVFARLSQHYGFIKDVLKNKIKDTSHKRTRSEKPVRRREGEKELRTRKWVEDELFGSVWGDDTSCLDSVDSYLRGAHSEGSYLGGSDSDSSYLDSDFGQLRLGYDSGSSYSGSHAGNPYSDSYAGSSYSGSYPGSSDSDLESSYLGSSIFSSPYSGSSFSSSSYQGSPVSSSSYLGSQASHLPYSYLPPNHESQRRSSSGRQSRSSRRSSHRS